MVAGSPSGARAPAGTRSRTGGGAASRSAGGGGARAAGGGSRRAGDGGARAAGGGSRPASASGPTKRELVQQAIGLVRENQAANDAFDEIAYEKLGINRTDGRCLDIIENKGPLTAGRLAELSGLTTAAVTAVLDRLERAGYARRVRSEQDRRQVMVELTPLMAERAGRIWGPLGEEAVEELSRMSSDELRAVIEFFRRGRELNERHLERVRGITFE